MRSPRAAALAAFLVLALTATSAVAAAGAVGRGSSAPSVGPAKTTYDPRTVALREKFFGADNVDARGNLRTDKVILTWTSVMTYAAAIGGHVVLLDAWVARGEHSGYVPTDPGELAMLRPSHVFLGHGHFDHAADAAQVVSDSGATLVGTPEHCDQVRAQALRSFGDAKVDCVAAAPRGVLPGKTTRLRALRGVDVDAVSVVHSGAQAPSRKEGLRAPIAPPSDFSVIADHPPAPEDVVHLGSHQTDRENGDLLYQFRVGDFALAWHDTSGPNTELGPAVFPALRRLPQTDVEVGSVQGFGQFTNAGRDFRTIVEALRPQELVPGHHDNWLPGVSTRGSRYRPYVTKELDRIPSARRPVLRWVQDPEDYLRPIAYDVDDARWDRR